ncbi:MAG: hypothetical protein EXR99_00510 [Gemmataceae bacterium]|nr:hypothetical protein [Gemmataceae bacterium]
MNGLFRAGVMACLFGLVLTAAQTVRAESWGTLKGRVIWAPAALPAPEKVKVNKDEQHCLSKGDILSDKFVVDPKTKGVKWVMVWLVDAKNPKAAIPIHPALKEPKGKTVALDQPCCVYEPHVFGMRAGQSLIAKNSSTVNHNVNIISTGNNPNQNLLIPAGKEIAVEGWSAAPTVTKVECNIHPWMSAWVRVFNHPYFAVTGADGSFELKNAPAGDFNLVIWQEETGWVKGGKAGTPVSIKADSVTDLGKIELSPSN